MPALMLILAALVTGPAWHVETQRSADGEGVFTYDVKRISPGHSATVEYVDWEDAPFWTWEVACHGSLVGQGEAETSAEAHRRAEIVLSGGCK